jgi:hypothetical protein
MASDELEAMIASIQTMAEHQPQLKLMQQKIEESLRNPQETSITEFRQLCQEILKEDRIPDRDAAHPLSWIMMFQMMVHEEEGFEGALQGQSQHTTWENTFSKVEAKRIEKAKRKRSEKKKESTGGGAVARAMSPQSTTPAGIFVFGSPKSKKANTEDSDINIETWSSTLPGIVLPIIASFFWGEKYIISMYKMSADQIKSTSLVCKHWQSKLSPKVCPRAWSALVPQCIGWQHLDTVPALVFAHIFAKLKLDCPFKLPHCVQHCREHGMT